MAAQDNPVIPNKNTTQLLPSEKWAGQINPPGAALFEAVQLSASFQTVSSSSSPIMQTVEPNSVQHKEANFQAPASHAARMPLLPPRGYPTMPLMPMQFNQTPSSLSMQRPPVRLPPPPPPLLAKNRSPVNGTDKVNSESSVTSGMPSAVGAMQTSMASVGRYGPVFAQKHCLESSESELQHSAADTAQPAPLSGSATAVSSLSVSARIQTTASQSVHSRPNELPVPFHGQGQYSHQINPFLQKSPADTPNNSGPPSQRTSRDSSPAFGISMDALEGQFTPGHGAPSPSFTGTRTSPIPSHAPGVLPAMTDTSTSTQWHNLPTCGQSQEIPAFSAPGQLLAPRPGYPSRPPQMAQHNQQFPGGQGPSQQPSLFHGQITPQATNNFSNPRALLPPASNIPPVMPSPLLRNVSITNTSKEPLRPPPSATPSSFPVPPGITPQPVAAVFPAPPPYMTEPAMPQYRQQSATVLPAAKHGHYPTPQAAQSRPRGVGTPAYPSSASAISQTFGQMNIYDSQKVLNLLNEKHLIPPDGIETATPTLPQHFNNVSCDPEVFRCTLNAVPQTSSLLNKSKLPLGILIHPFKDLSQLPVIQSSVIVRCRACRSYINPYVTFIDQRKWKCNICFRANDLPDEFSFDPVSKTYGHSQQRPEITSATIEFIAPSEYMLRPPQPAVYLFLLDVSANALETGYVSRFCHVLLEELDRIPGDSRTSIGFLCYDKSLYYFNLSDGLSRPQMLCVTELEDPFLPCPDSLLVNLNESKELVTELLKQLPRLFEGHHETDSALGTALQASLKLMSATGGRVTVMQTCLPTLGPGALQNRESGCTSAKSSAILGPATDFYKKLALDYSKHQIAVDLFMLNGLYADIATLSCISKYTAGSVYYYPSFHTLKNPGLVAKFNTDFRRYLTRKIGFESVMRIRCTRGLSIHTFHGNFFVRSTDLLSLPNINPDAGFGMQMSIEDNLTESNTVSFQAALLYTSSKGERKIRVHTLCVPVSNQLSEIFTSADQLAIASLLAKMAVDRSLTSSLSDARDSITNAALDALSAYAQQIPATQRVGALVAPSSLRLMPILTLAMLKSFAFSQTGNVKIDDRVFDMQQCKTLPVGFLIQKLLPHLYSLLDLNDEKPLKHGKEESPSAALLPLSSASIHRAGLFLLDTGETMCLFIGSEVGNQICQDVFGEPDFLQIVDGMKNLPELNNPTSKKICTFISYLKNTRPHGVTFLIVRDNSANRHLLSQYLLEDRTEHSMSYFELLQYLQGKVKG